MAATVDLREWWKPFRELELDRLVARAVEANLPLQEADARVSAALALERAASAVYRPELHLATAPVNAPDASRGFFQAGLEAGWDIGLFGREDASGLAASADTGMARADAQAIHASVVAETVRAYLEWRAAQAESSNIDARMAVQLERVELMRARVRLRLSTQMDVDAEESRTQELRARRLEMDRATTDATERLGLLLALTDAETPNDPPTADIPSIASFRLSELPADLLRNRADIRHAEQAVLKASAERDVARADLYPRLTLGGSLMLALPVSGVAGGASRFLASAGPAIDIPLFDWGRRRARVDAQDSTLAADLLAYREKILEGVHEVETALATLETLRLDADLRRGTAENAARAEQAARAAANLNRASRLDVLAAEMGRLEAEASVLDAERAHSLAYVALFQALGGAPLPAAPS